MYPAVGDQEAVEQAEGAADEYASKEGDDDALLGLDEDDLRDDDSADRDVGADRHVDARRDDDDRHADADQGDRRNVAEQRLDGAGR